MISDRIKDTRKKNQLTQTELAKKLNITRSSVNAWEMGVSVPSTQYLIKLSKVFKVTTDFLLDLSDNETINIENLKSDEKEIIFMLVKKFEKENDNLKSKKKDFYDEKELPF